MSDNAERAWRFYLDDMICFAEKVTAYTLGPVSYTHLDVYKRQV